MVGSTVLHYKIVEKLGSGGMGDIYKAQDTRLNRFVAVKVLPAGKSGDPERRRRFIQEAQAASALNHPNIIIIHDIVSEDPTQFLIMEFVSGKTLADLIPVGGLRVPQVLQYSVQMADALNAAHAAGIIHRDFKPANVMVTSSGLVKVLDFGLAKLTDWGTSQMGDETMTTGGAPLTVEGAIMGTVSYMSPEQAEGKRVDSRSDIFSFGSVLYEMVTGARAFDGDSGISTLSAVLRDEVKPISQVAPDVPAALEDVIARCLKKDPDARFQAMGDVQSALTAIKRQSDSGILYRSQSTMTLTPETPAASKPPSTPAAAPAPAPPPTKADSKAQPKAPPKPAAPKKPLSKGLIYGMSGGVSALVLAAVGGWWFYSHRVQQQPVPPLPEPPVASAPQPQAPQPAAETPAEQPQQQPPAQEAAKAVPPPPHTNAAKAVPAQKPAPVETYLTNNRILDLVRSKVAPGDIINQIKSSKTNFEMSPSEISRLTQAGVPQNVIAAMRASKAASTAAQTAALPPPPATPPPAPNPPAKAADTKSAPARGVAAQGVPVTVADALPFRIALDQDVPANVEGGQQLRFTVIDGLVVDGSVVIAKGAAITGEVLGETKKFLGMGGKTTFRLLQADAVDGQKIPVRATAGRGAEGPATRTFATGKGSKSKELAAPKGTEYIAYVDGQHTVSVKK